MPETSEEKETLRRCAEPPDVITRGEMDAPERETSQSQNAISPPANVHGQGGGSLIAVGART